MNRIKPSALVFYKNKPACVTDVNDKIEISFLKKSKRVREKDIIFLHSGPIKDTDKLDSTIPENIDSLNDTLELLTDEEVNLEDLSELLFGKFNAQNALYTWLLVSDNLYFEGTPEAIKARSLDDITTEKRKRNEKKEKQKKWDALLLRINENKIIKEDYPQLVEVEQLAVGERESSKLLKTLKVKESKEAAHTLLLKLGYWKETYNPWPKRLGINLSNPCLIVPNAIEENQNFIRKDLRHLEAWAIDDIGNKDPDDAISIEGDRLWIHIADVSSIVTPNCELDIDARSRGANLYLPDKVIPMLPTAITKQCGLGLKAENKALSINFIINKEGKLDDVNVYFSLVKVTRTTYEEADNEIETTFFKYKELTDRYHKRRLANNASELNFPEVNINVVDNQVSIRPFSRTKSRQLVTEAMLAAGEAIGIFALENNIPIPFASQPEPEEIKKPSSKLSEHYAYRRLFKPSEHITNAAPHFGLGLPFYTRVTSPIRRYLDLVVHQQIRAFFAKQPLLNNEDLVERIGLTNEVSFPLRKAERLSRQFWTLIYLKQNPKWQGKAIVIDQDERKNMIVIPKLAFETKIAKGGDLALDSEIDISLESVNIVDLTVRFKH